jgi:hypothetical protein
VEISAVAKRKHSAKLPPERDGRRRISQRNAERNRAIYARRLQGVFLERIGDEFGLSGEQVRQIVIKEERRRKEGNKSAR